MTKSELIAELAAANPHLRSYDVETIVATTFEEISYALALARGERVELRGFGAFTVKLREARTGRNPQTGASVAVHEKSVPFFKAGKELRLRVNAGRIPGASRAERQNPRLRAIRGLRAVEHGGRIARAFEWIRRPQCSLVS